MIKFFIFSVSLLFTMGCTTTTTTLKQDMPDKKTLNIQAINSAPNWYFKIPLNQYEIIGYGSGLSIEEAKANARNDISKSILVHIKSESNFKHTVIEKNKDFNQTKIMTSNIHEYTNIVLAESKMIKYQKTDNKFYVALSYVNLPLDEKIFKNFKNYKLKHINQKSIYKYSLFSEMLKSKFGYTPSYDLIFKNGIYYLNLGNKLFVMQNSDLKLFFFNYSNPDIDFKVSSNNLKTNDFFHFNISSAKNGYMSLIQVDEEGRIIVHIDNQKINKVHDLTYPDLKIYKGLEAGIVDMSNNIQEEYILTVCSEKINLSLFEHIDLSYNTNSKALRYPKLDALISSCDYSAIILKIKRRD